MSRFKFETDITAIGVCKLLSMIAGYVYVPVALNYLGVEKYGVWATIVMILSWINNFDLGIGNGLRNKLTESLALKDGESKKLISSAYAVASVVMIVVATAFSVMAVLVDWQRIFRVSDIRENLSGVIIICVVFVSLNFVLSICKNVLFALQNPVSVSVMDFLVQMFNLIGLVAVKNIFESNLFVMSSIYGISMLSVSVISSIILYIKRSDVRPSVFCVNMHIGMKLTSVGVQFFVIQICALVLFATDNLIISYLYGASKVTPYSAVNQLFGAVVSIYAAILAPVWSATTKAKAEGNIKELKTIIVRYRWIMLLIGGGVILLSFIFRPVMRFWLRRELNFETGLIVLGGIYCMLSNWCNTYANVINGLELMKVAVPIAIVQAMSNIPLSLYFAEYLGWKSTGVLAGTICSMLIAAIIFPVAVKKEIKRLEEI